MKGQGGSYQISVIEQISAGRFLIGTVYLM